MPFSAISVIRPTKIKKSLSLQPNETFQTVTGTNADNNDGGIKFYHIVGIGIIAYFLIKSRNIEGLSSVSISRSNSSDSNTSNRRGVAESNTNNNIMMIGMIFVIIYALFNI